MFEFFSTIGRSITVFFSWLGTIIRSLVQLVTLLFQSVALPVQIAGFLPDIIASAVMITVLVAVANRLSGGGGGG